MVYDRRIIGQVDLYYLSKIFSRFKETLNKMQKKNNQKAAKAYISNLRKRFFRLLLEGVAMSRL